MVCELCLIKGVTKKEKKKDSYVGYYEKKTKIHCIGEGREQQQKNTYRIILFME